MVSRVSGFKISTEWPIFLRFKSQVQRTGSGGVVHIRCDNTWMTGGTGFCTRSVPVLFCSVPFCSVLFCSALFRSALFCSVPFCSVPFCSVLFCSVLLCSVLLCSVLACPWSQNQRCIRLASDQNLGQQTNAIQRSLVDLLAHHRG